MAIVDPVQIDGTTVTRVSVHNMAWIKEVGLKINSRVLLEKRNQIIPYISEVIGEGDKDIVLNVCPSCGRQLKTINGQQFCTNLNCKERIAQNISFLGRKDVLDIPGLSIQTARKIVDEHWTAAQYLKQNIIFGLKLHHFQTLPGFADKSAQKLYDAIQAARKDVELPRFIKALCIPGIGNNIGKLLADKYGSLDELCVACTGSGVVGRLQRIDGIGPVAAKAIASDEFWGAVAVMKSMVTIAPYKSEATVGEFVGKVFVLTGKMAHPRSYYVEKIEAAGGKEGSAVNSNTDYLVIQDVNSQSSKAKKARELGTALISPEELEEMLNG